MLHSNAAPYLLTAGRDGLCTVYDVWLFPVQLFVSHWIGIKTNPKDFQTFLRNKRIFSYIEFDCFGSKLLRSRRYHFVNIPSLLLI